MVTTGQIFNIINGMEEHMFQKHEQADIVMTPSNKSVMPQLWSF